MPGVAGNVLTGNQQLGHNVVVFAKNLVVEVHQLALTHSGGCLLGRYIRRPFPQPQLAHTHANGTGGYQNHFISGVFDITDGLAQCLHPPNVQIACGMGQGGGADFYNNTHKNTSNICFFTLYSPPGAM